MSPTILQNGRCRLAVDNSQCNSHASAHGSDCFAYVPGTMLSACRPRSVSIRIMESPPRAASTSSTRGCVSAGPGTLETAGRSKRSWAVGSTGSARVSSGVPRRSGKMVPPMGPGRVAQHLLDAIDARCARLNTDYVDLYQPACGCSATPLDETLEASTPSFDRARPLHRVSNFLAYRLRARSADPTCCACAASCRSNRATACCFGRSSASCCRWPGRRSRLYRTPPRGRL